MVYLICMWERICMIVTINYPQTEESIDVSVHDSDSFTTNLSSRNIESKKYSKISKTSGKRNTSDTKGLVPEYKKM